LFESNRRLAEKAFTKFRRPLAEILYDLTPTDNIAELIFSHVNHMICFYNRVAGATVPYLYAVQVGDRWFTMSVHGQMHESTQIWVESFNHADFTVGYASIDRRGTQWLVTDGGRA
ncbi:MAG TPA: hypothetical protein VIY48_10455, partial [Candidatus Paceibacterota bacterium]